MDTHSKKSHIRSIWIVWLESVTLRHHLFFHRKSKRLFAKSKRVNIRFRVRVTGRVQCSSTRKQTIRYTDTEKKLVQRFEVEPNTEYSIYIPPGIYTFSVKLERKICFGLFFLPFLARIIRCWCSFRSSFNPGGGRCWCFTWFSHRSNQFFPTKSEIKRCYSLHR